MSLKQIVESGVSNTDTKSGKLNVILSNYISIVLIVLPTIMLIARVILEGLEFNLNAFLIICCSLVFSIPIFLNRHGYINVSRFLLSWLPSFFVLFMSVVLMKQGTIYDTSTYIGIRFFLLSFCCVPFLIFNLKNTYYLLLCLLLPTFLLLCYDIILNFFEVGYWQTGHTDKHYSLTNARVLVAYLLIGFSFYFLKRIFEKSEELNERLLIELARQNKFIQENAAQEVHQLNQQLQVNLQQLQVREFILNDSQRIAKIGSWEYRIKDKFFFCSDEIYNIFGLDRSVNIEPASLTELIWREQSNVLIDATKTLLRTGLNYDLTLKSKTPLGYIKWARIYATPIVESNKITGIRGICHDITQYKEAEEMLRNSEYRYRSLFEQASDSIVITDFDGNFIDVNASLCNMLGYAKDEILKVNISALIEPEQQKNDPVSFDKLIQGEHVFRERRMRHKNGSIIDVEANIKKFGSNQMMAIARDITKRKQIEYEKEYTRYQLNERIKELTTLYHTSQILHTENDSIDVILQKVVSILPQGWQYPEISAARIVFIELEFKSTNFVEAPYCQRAPFNTPRGNGMVEVVYLIEKPAEAEGPFLAEERNLINMIAEMLGVYLTQIHESDELKKSEANVHAIINNTDILIWSVDRDFHLITFNEPFQKHMKFRYGVHVTPGMNMLGMDPTPEGQQLRDKWINYCLRAMSGEIVNMEEARFEIYLHYSLSPIIVDDKIIGVSIFATDVTERKINEKALVEAHRKIGESKLVALRSVMSPHFIFNVLNSIQFYIAKNDRLNAINYLSTFSKLIRSILTHSVNNKIKLADEIDMLKNYVNLEMTRFENKFDFVFTVEPDIDLDDISIPSLLIQPYVENAILHGLYNKLEKGTLSLRIFQQEETIIFEIEDDGIGREAAMVLRQKNFPGHKSVGIKVTEERLRLINENQHASFEIEDLTNALGPAGTRVRIRIHES